MRPIRVIVSLALVGLPLGAYAQHQNNVAPPKAPPQANACQAKKSTIYKERVYVKSSPGRLICVGKCEAEFRGVQWNGDQGVMAFVYTGKSCGG